MTFGEKILKLRLDRHLSQQRVANDLGVSQTGISGYERGLFSPTIETVWQFATYYHVNPLSLLPLDQDGTDEAYSTYIVSTLSNNPKLRMLFELAKDFSDSEVETLLHVARAISDR